MSFFFFSQIKKNILRTANQFKIIVKKKKNNLEFYKKKKKFENLNVQYLFAHSKSD